MTSRAAPDHRAVSRGQLRRRAELRRHRAGAARARRAARLHLPSRLFRRVRRLRLPGASAADRRGADRQRAAGLLAGLRAPPPAAFQPLARSTSSRPMSRRPGRRSSTRRSRAEAPLRQLLARLRPDAIVLDNVVMFPAIATAGVPWVRMVSCAETELPDPTVPPYLSGLAADDTPAAPRSRSAIAQAVAPAHERFNRFRAERRPAAAAAGHVPRDRRPGSTCC